MQSTHRRGRRRTVPAYGRDFRKGRIDHDRRLTFGVHIREAPPNFIVALALCTASLECVLPAASDRRNARTGPSTGFKYCSAGRSGRVMSCDGLPVRPTDQWCRRTECDRDGGVATLSCISLGIYARFAACTVGSRTGCPSWLEGCLTGVCEIAQGVEANWFRTDPWELAWPASMVPSRDLTDPRGVSGLARRGARDPMAALISCLLSETACDHCWRSS